MILRRLTSLRARLLLGVIVGLVALQAASSVVVYALQRSALYNRFDQALMTTAKALAPQAKHEKSKGVHFDVEKVRMPEFQRPKGPDYFQVWRSDGSVIARSQTLGEANLPMVRPGQKAVAYDCELPRGEAGRAVLMTVELQQKGPPERRNPPQAVTLVVARGIHPVRDDLWTLGWILAGTSLTGLVVAGGLALAIVTHGLRPLRRVARQIAEVEPSALGNRIDPVGLPTELQPVAQRLNEMLERLHVAFERERGFTADAAHEFRNPIAGIRSIGEVALSAPQTVQEYAEDLRQIVALAAGMQAMVEKLFLLARLDAGQIKPSLSQVQVGAVVGESLASLGSRLAARNIAVENTLPSIMTATADQDLLTLAVKNILDNAVEYAESDGQIRLEATASDSTIVLSISNTCRSMGPQEAAHVFERFWRADRSRSPDGSHAGLGLSLVSRAMSVMGGSAEAFAGNGEFTLRLHFQAREAADGSARKIGDKVT